MKISNFKKIIKEAVREELRASLPELLKEQAGLESKKPPVKKSDFMQGISHAMNLQDQAKNASSKLKDLAQNIDTESLTAQATELGGQLQNQLSSIDTSGLSNALGNFGGFG